MSEKRFRGERLEAVTGLKKLHRRGELNSVGEQLEMHTDCCRQFRCDENTLETWMYMEG